MGLMEIFNEDGTYIAMDQGVVVATESWIRCDDCHQPAIKKEGKFHDYPDGSWVFIGGCCK